MGTETLKAIAHFLATCVHFKLNNPLMGTEIHLRYTLVSYFFSFHVKLNNPHKGTAIGRSPIKLRCKY